MAMQLLDLVIARSQLQCKLSVLFDSIRKDEGFEGFEMLHPLHWRSQSPWVGGCPSFFAMRPCKSHKGKGVI